MAYEFLKEHLGDDLYKQVVEKLKGKEGSVKLVNLADGKYVDVDKYNTAVERTTALEAQLKDTQTSLSELEKTAGDNAKLSKQIQEMQTKYDNDTKELNARMAQREFDYTLDSEIKAKNARNSKTIIPLLDTATLRKKDGTFDTDAFNAQIANIAKENPYLFKNEVQHGAGGAPFNPQGGQGSASDNPFKFNFAAVNKMPEKK